MFNVLKYGFSLVLSECSMILIRKDGAGNKNNVGPMHRPVTRFVSGYLLSS